jgi:hypothetical protein
MQISCHKGIQVRGESTPLAQGDLPGADTTIEVKKKGI